MRGEIIDVEWSFHAGITRAVISGEDGITYNFGNPEWHESSLPQTGMIVFFFVVDGYAHSVTRFDFRSSLEHAPMKGSVLYFDQEVSEGTIYGNDGKWYSVTGLDWRDAGAPEAGRTVDFICDGDRARDVRRVAHTGAYPKSKGTAAFLALFLGLFGIHKFYLGFFGQGVVMLLSTIVGSAILWFVYTINLIGFLVLMAVAVVSFVEFVTYLARSDESFHETYVVKKQRWF